MKIVSRSVFFLAMLLSSFSTVFSMELAMEEVNDSLENQQAIPSYKEIEKAFLSVQLRNYFSDVNDKEDFEKLLRRNPFLLEYVAEDGLTIGEYIVEEDKKAYKEFKQTKSYSYSWQSYQESTSFNRKPLFYRVLFFKITIDCFREALAPNSPRSRHTLKLIWDRLKIGSRGSSCFRSYIQEKGLRPDFYYHPEGPSDDELAVIKKAHRVVEFIQALESEEFSKALTLFKEHQWLARAYKPEAWSGTLTPLQLITDHYEESSLPSEARTLGALLIMNGASLEGEIHQELEALSKEFQENPELFKSRWGNLVKAPSLHAVHCVSRVQKLRTLAVLGNDREFEIFLSWYPWLLDMPGSDGDTIGEFIVKEYKATIMQTYALRKSNQGWIKKQITVEDSEKAKNLLKCFKKLSQNCSEYKNPEAYFKVQRALFYFYEGLECHESLETPWLYSFYYNNSSPKSYRWSLLHRCHSWFPNNESHYTTYHAKKAPELLETGERCRAQLVCLFFLYIKRGRFTDALELLEENQWLALAKKCHRHGKVKGEKEVYSKTQVEIDAQFREQEGYVINSLAAVFLRLNQGNIFLEEVEPAKRLTSLLLAYGADPHFTTKRFSLDAIRAQGGNSYDDIRSLIDEHGKDPQAFYDSLFPKPVEEEVVEDPVVEAAVQEDPRVDEYPVELKQQGSAYLMPALKVTALVAGYFIGRYCAKQRHVAALKKDSSSEVKSKEDSSEKEKSGQDLNSNRDAVLLKTA